MVLFHNCIFLSTVLYFSHARDFSYKGASGPEHWAEEYSTCNGKYQSPVNIATYSVKQIFFEKMVFRNFDEKPINGTVLNNGHTAVVQLKYTTQTPYVEGGPFINEAYSFVQMHFHWGQNNLEGSEDRINNKSFPAELHIVLRNTVYKNFDEAVQHQKGVAVLAAFFVIQNQDNPSYEELTLLLENIRKTNSSVSFLNPPSLKSMLPMVLSSYFTYIGSLTTPPCSEDVIWIDFNEPIGISERQLKRLRDLKDSDGAPLVKNFRPIQPLNDRMIYFHAYDREWEFSGGIPMIINSSLSPKLFNECMTNIFISFFVIIAKAFY